MPQPLPTSFDANALWLTRIMGGALLSLLGCSLETTGTALSSETATDSRRLEDEKSAFSGQLEDTRMRHDAAAAKVTANASRGRETLDAGVRELGSSDTKPPPASEDDAVSAPRADASAAATPPPERAGSCRIEGSYALHTEVEIAWDGWMIGGLPVLSPGQGTFTMDALSVLREEAKEVIVRPCGATIPDFETERSLLTPELYGADVPDAAWEQPSMPSWHANWSASCYEPGCTVFSGAIQAIIGARVTSEPFSWPGARDPRTNFEVADDDGDGLPGLTLLTRGPEQANDQGRAYAYPPLVPTLFSRARKIMMALGLRTQMEGKLEGCDGISGSLSIDGLHSRALGCVGQIGPDIFECAPEHVQFLDENLPVWKVRSAKFRSVRIENESCAAVRSALRAQKETARKTTAPPS